MKIPEKRLRRQVRVAFADGRPERRLSLLDGLQQALGSFRAGDLDTAAALCRQITQQVPNCEQSRALWAEVLVAAHRPTAARKVLAPVLAAADDPDTLLVGSRVARRLLDFESGCGLIERAIRLDRSRADLRLEAATCAVERGDRDAAAAAVQAAIERDPYLAGAYWQRAQLDLDEHADAHLAELTRFVDAGSFTPAERAYLHFAIARIHQRRGRLADEFRHLEIANAAVARERPWTPEREAHKHARIERFVARGLAACAGVGDRTRRPLVVTSMPRAGSTLVERVLGAHPDVTPCGEIGVFAVSITALMRALGVRDHDELWDDRFTLAGHVEALAGFAGRFLDQLPIPTPVFTEKTIDNFAFLPFLLTMFPAARAIHVLRDPLDSALSTWQLHFAESNGYAYDLRKMAVRYRQHLAVMERWRELFPGRIHTVHYEDLVARQRDVTRDLLQFAGLGWDEHCIEFHAARAAVRTGSALQVRRPLYATSVGRHRPYGALLRPVADELGRPLVE
ncbi:MAG: sulfotransferase [Planctomycetes bacterium]|nr:sulfotransferase [Planctomycetota bacterium]